MKLRDSLGQHKELMCRRKNYEEDERFTDRDLSTTGAS